MNYNTSSHSSTLHYAMQASSGLYKLKNDPIFHDPRSPHMPSKIPSDISNFEWKMRESPSTHMTTYNVWGSPKSLVDDFIRLILFERNLTTDVAK